MVKAVLFFLPEHHISDIVPFGEGNINDTFAVTLQSGEQRILQRLNPDVFPDPELVMRNIRLVLDHLSKQLQRESFGGGNFTPLSLYRGKTGDWYRAEDRSIWRLMSMVKDCRTCQSVSTVNQARELGHGLGFFHRMLSTLDPGKLADTLPGFHDTPEYLRQYDAVLSSHVPHTSHDTDFCCRFIEQRRSLVTLLRDMSQKLTHGIIHGDPKVANFLFNRKMEKVISLIDLDTVKPGMLLYDIGDALRSCCNPEGETPRGKNIVFFDPEMFQAWLEGYFSRAGFLLTRKDLEHIVDSTLLISFELGLRFFSDYVAGNRYFKILYNDQNLHRAMVQFSLVRSIEKQHNALVTMMRNTAEDTNLSDNG